MPVSGCGMWVCGVGAGGGEGCCEIFLISCFLNLCHYTTSDYLWVMINVFGEYLGELLSLG